MTKVDAVVSGRELTLDLCAELRRLAPFGLGNPGVTLLLPVVRARRPGAGRQRQAPALPRPRARAATRAARSRSASAPSSTATGSEGRYDVVFRLEENHWNGTVAPQLVVRRVLDAPEGYEGLRDWLAEQWGLEEAQRAPEAQTIFVELGLSADTNGKRPLLESEAFRALLAEPALARAA